nr:GNAT family N-acetyltransferase [Pseudopedobacter sp.]
MILYRQANDNDFDFTFKIKTNSTKQLVEKIWGWDDTVQLDHHKNQFNPHKIKIIIDEKQQVGYISTFVIENILFIENILIDTPFQGKKIGTKVLIDTIKSAVEQKKRVELQVFKINDRAIKLYERLNFQTFGQTDLHYKMRYKEN